VQERLASARIDPCRHPGVSLSHCQEFWPNYQDCPELWISIEPTADYKATVGKIQEVVGSGFSSGIAPARLKLASATGG